MCTHGVHALQKCVSQTHSMRFDELIALLKNPKMLQMYTIWNFKSFTVRSGLSGLQDVTELRFSHLFR